jgi:hypothetical protein
MDYQKLIEKLTDIYNSPKPKSYQDFEKLYCNIMIYKIDIKANVSKLLFDNYKKNIDNLIFEILFYENDNDNNNDNNETTSSFFIMLKEIIEYLKSNFKFDEDQFISSLLNSYYENNDNDNDNDNDEDNHNNNEILDFIETYIQNYTIDNSTDYNIFLINKYSNINEAIDLYKRYLNINLDFKETKTDYDDLSLIVLFHNFYEKILKIIIDDYDSSNETIINY